MYYNIFSYNKPLLGPFCGCFFSIQVITSLIRTLLILDTLQKMTDSLLVNVDIPINTHVRLTSRISLYQIAISENQTSNISAKF